jgi:hypothetical protein
MNTADEARAPDGTRAHADIRHEIADVALALAVYVTAQRVTVEECIREKTEYDRGRGQRPSHIPGPSERRGYLNTEGL